MSDAWFMVTLCAALLHALTACGDSGASQGGNCDVTLPATCPSPMPGYQADIAPILASRCTSCHSAGGQQANRDLSNYASVYSQRQEILTQVHSCLMPLAGSPALTASQSTALLTWLICQAPKN